MTHKIRYVGYGMVTYVECTCGHRAPYGPFRTYDMANGSEGVDLGDWVCVKDPQRPNRKIRLSGGVTDMEANSAFGNAHVKITGDFDIIDSVEGVDIMKYRIEGVTFQSAFQAQKMTVSSC